MRHEAICNLLDAKANLHRAEALLDDLEPSSGARHALEEKVAELHMAADQAAVRLAIPEEPERRASIIPPPLAPRPPLNGIGVFFDILLCVASCVGIYLLSAALLRRFAA
jgi:hypothetical protein